MSMTPKPFDTAQSTYWVTPSIYSTSVKMVMYRHGVSVATHNPGITRWDCVV